MTTERTTPDEPVADLIRDGWREVDPEEARSRLGFLPDHLLRRGEEYFVLQMVRQGRSPARPVADMRRAVEGLPNWHFDVKLRGPMSVSAENETDDEVGDRLSVARQLLDTGHRSEAILIAWVAIEASLRRLAARPDRPADLAMSSLVRQVYEADAITDAELRHIDRAKDLRNQIVHGFKARMVPEDGETVLSLADALARRAHAPEPAPLAMEAH